MKSNHQNLRVGVIGAGTMGQHHVRILSQTAGVDMVGFHDPDRARSADICQRHRCSCFDSLDPLLERLDAVVVAAPTSLHLEIGERCLERGIHVLMEKPLAHDLLSAGQMVEMARSGGLVLAVGHVERHNPAVVALFDQLHGQPEEIVSIDARRLAPFDGSRCLDVDVLYDLLIHDVDLASEIADSDVRSVSTSGRSVFSKQTDVVHVCIEFENRAVAAFWAAKCSPLKLRSITVTTASRYLTADTLERTLTVYTADQLPALEDGVCLMGNIRREEIPVLDLEPLRREIDDFLQSIRTGTKPVVDGERALKAMQVLDRIAAAMRP